MLWEKIFPKMGWLEFAELVEIRRHGEECRGERFFRHPEPQRGYTTLVNVLT